MPPPLLAHAGIEKEVVVVGVGDHLEVWGRERWESEQQSLDAEIEEVTERLGHAS
jgi:MraZ protein